MKINTILLLATLVNGAFLRSSDLRVLSTSTSHADMHLFQSRDLLRQTHEAQRLAYESREPNATAAEPQKYVPTGCRKVDASTITPANPVGYDGQDGKLTLDTCYYYCVEIKALWMLITKGNECMCADEFGGGDSDDCDTNCEGDANEKCGGNEGTSTFLMTAWVPKLVSKPCAAPTAIPNAVSMCGGGGLPDFAATCNITCGEGHLLKENAMLCDGSTGEWFGHALCKEIVCGLPQPIPNSVNVCQSASVLKSDCPVECLPGFELKTNTLLCHQAAPDSAVGLFEGEALCEPVSCGLPPAMEFALYNGEHEAVFPSITDYACMKGFTDDGTPTGATAFGVNCQEDKSFTELLGSCKPIECGIPPIVQFALTTKTESAFFNSATEYACDEGYYVGGYATGPRSLLLDCTATGEFAEPEPCEPVICGIAPQLALATTELEPREKLLTLGEIVRYNCEPGYSVDRQDKTKTEFIATCDASGQFVGIPICHPVLCHNAPSVPNALVAEAELVFTSMAVYECVAGHSIDGTVEANRSFSIDCTSEAELTNPGECLPVTCPPPPQAVHRTLVTDAPHKFGNALTFGCDEGFSTDGTENSGAKVVVSACQESGEWAEVLPCIDIDDCLGHSCGPSGTCVDEHMAYHCSCESGFEVVNDEETGEPTCGNIDDCGDCGVGICEDLVNDFTCHCPEGYELVTEPEKTCQAVLCGEPPKVPHAVRPDQKAFYPDAISYVCDPGTSTDATAEGPTAFIVGCLANREFTGEQECKMIECGPPPMLLNAESDKPSAVFNDTVHYKCSEGHSTDATPAGEKEFGLGCMATGQYAQPLPCLPIDCGSPSPIIGGLVDAAARTYQMTSLYSCEEGHSTDGTPAEASLTFEVACAADGTFSGTKACIPVQCGAPPHYEKAFASVEETMAYPLGVEYMCDEGYTLDGQLEGLTKFHLSCGPSGDMVGDLEASCQPISCAPIEILNSVAVTTAPAAVFPGEFEYKCEPGFAVELLASDASHVSPEDAVTTFALSCQANGELTPPPMCKNIDDCHGHSCGAHGTCVDLIEDYTCDCQAGFEINTDKNGEKTCGNVDDCKDHQCGEYGVCQDFTGGYTCQCVTGYPLMDLEEGHKTCEAAVCPAMEEIEHAAREGSGTLKFPETSLFVCEPGYSTDGTPTPESREFVMSCLASGELSMPSACHPVVCGVAPAAVGAFATVDPLSSHAFGTELTYECAEGHSTDGTKAGPTSYKIDCNANALFTEALGCFPKSCGAPPQVAEASVAEEVIFPGEAFYECASGFSMDGSADKVSFTVPCLADGSFGALPEELGEGCQRVSCGAPPHVPHASYDDSVKLAGDGVLYVCDEGFTASGTQAGLAEFSIACDPTGQYSPLAAVECVMITVTVSGQVKDATNNAPISGVTVKATQVRGGQEHETVTTTNGAGIYSFTLGLGEVRMNEEKEGLISTEKSHFFVGNVPAGAGADVSMSPVLPPDGWRVVLKWDAKPYDLDSHFFYGTGGTSCHMFWARTTVFCRNQVKATLDVDDTNGYGPETSTLQHLNAANCARGGCDIKFVVHNYSRNPSIAASGAVVSLYNGDRLAGEYRAGVDGVLDGDMWDVFTLDGATGAISLATTATKNTHAFLHDGIKHHTKVLA